MVWPTIPIAAVAAQARTVNQTTQGFRRCVASDIAPNSGIETAIKADEIPLPRATIVFDAPRSDTSHTAK
jgi:hypothetical protein